MAKPELTEWDEDLTASAEEEYEALVRAIRWAKGFGLLFVQCSPAQGEELIARVRDDVTDKAIDVLPLEGEVDDLYATVAALPYVDKTNVLFVTGLEKSLVPYIKPGYGSEGDYYAKDTVPKILGKLNLQREKFRETLKLCFVFLVPPYAMKYLIRRAADFFDWRSGVWEFVGLQEELQEKTQQILQEGDYTQYRSWTPQQRRERILEIDDLLADDNHSPDEISRLRFEQGNICLADQQCEWALSCYDAALAIKPNNHEALNNKGHALSHLGFYEQAIVVYDAALAANPSLFQAIYNKGYALANLGRYEEAITFYDAILAIKSEDLDTLFVKGIALNKLGRYEESIASCDASLAIEPDDSDVLNNKGVVLVNLGRYKEAVDSYNAALAINSDHHQAFNNKGIALHKLGCYEESISSYDAALAIKSDDHEALNNKGYALDQLGCYEQAIASYDAALAIQPDYHRALNNKGYALLNLGHYEEAISCYDAALAIQPDDHDALNNKGIALQKLGRNEEVILSLLKALESRPKLKWRERLQRFILRRIVSMIKSANQPP